MAVPVTLVTGFLGAGKTTLLRHLLAGDHGRRIGVVVNDFGALDIDAELIREVHGETNTVRLTNGCVCCSVRGDLLETVAQLTARPEPPDWIVVETSGISDPQQVAATFALPEIAPIARLDSVVTVVDADGFPRTRDASRALATRQIEAADLVLVNKTDLVDTAQREAVEAVVRRLAPQARTLACRHGRVPLDVLLGPDAVPSPASRTGYRRAGPPASAPDHAAEYASFVWESLRPLDAERLREAIRAFPRSILRGKGFVRTVQAPDEEGEFHLVGERATLTRGRPWHATPRTRLVFISERDATARAQVAALLDAACAAGNEAPA
jgi:G3E family GTPase